jgi:hypothetical protein
VRERVAGRVVGVVGVIVNPRRRSRAEADTFFSIGRTFVRDCVVADDGEGEWEMMEGVIPWVSCPGCVDVDVDGSGGVAETETETEGARARREEDLAMASEGCRECVRDISPREGGDVDGDIVNADGGDDDGVDALLSAL